MKLFNPKIHSNCVKCLSLDKKTKIYLFILINNSNLGSSVSVVVLLRTGIVKELGVAQLVQWLYIYELECWMNRGSSVSVVIILRTGVVKESG